MDRAQEEVERLREELQARESQRQVTDLQQQLAAARAESAGLRRQLDAARDAAPAGAGDQLLGAPAGSLPKLQERLSRLRKEQAEAEAARAAAWAELKAVVSDISCLAAVDNLASVNIPKAQ